MPLTEDILGTNADGTKNEEYCIYCYKDGAFTGDFTMEEMAEFCSQFVDEFNKNTGQSLSREEYKKALLQFYPTLKRWQLPADELPHATSPIKQQLIEEVNLRYRCTVLLVTHNAAIGDMSDRVIWLRDGAVVRDEHHAARIHAADLSW